MKTPHRVLHEVLSELKAYVPHDEPLKQIEEIFKHDINAIKAEGIREAAEKLPKFYWGLNGVEESKHDGEYMSFDQIINYANKLEEGE